MISIVMTSWKRAPLLENTLQSIERQKLDEPLEVVVVEDGDDNGETRAVCRARPRLVSYIQRKNRPDVPYCPPAIPNNIGIRQSAGDVIIIQNAEVLHVHNDVIARLAAVVRENPKNVAFAQVLALNPSGQPYAWYCHARWRARAFFFCGAISRELVFALRGFDEDYITGYGYDDDNFEFRMAMSGAKFVFTDALCHHQFHPGVDCWGLQSNEQMHQTKLRSFMEGTSNLAANLERDWGVSGG